VRDSEAGQVLVLIVFMIVGLLGFAALAIDGGMLLAERRRAQNAADAGVMAAALDKIWANNLFATALQRIASNGYTSVSGPCTPDGYDCLLGTGENWVIQVNSPPRWGDFAGNNRYIQVTITSEVDTAFAHLVFSGPLQTTVEAVSRVWWEEELAAGTALIATTEHDCKGIWFTGTGDTTVSGGDIYSNSDASAKNCMSGVQGGAGNVTVEEPNRIIVAGNFEEGGSGSVFPNPTPFNKLTQAWARFAHSPDCSNLTYRGSVKVKANQKIELMPGRYESIVISSPGSEVTLLSGMYCITGDKGFTGTGGLVQVKDGNSGVMIYLQRGPFDLGGSTEVKLWAETSEDALTDGSGFDWRGMLIYADTSNSSIVKITGTTDSAYTGTIFAPKSECVILGTGDSIAINSQVICYTVKVAGTADIQIRNDSDYAFIVPPSIDLVE
jgi:hypothetical protein